MSENAPPPPPPGSGGNQPPPPPPPPGSGGNQPPPPPPGSGEGWGSPPPPPPGGGGPGGYGGPGGPGYPGGPGGPGGSGAGGPYGAGPEQYNVGSAFSYAWKKFQENLLPLILITLIVLVGVGIVQLIGSLIQGAVVPERTFNFETGEFEGGGGGLFGLAMILSLLFNALSWAVSLIIQAGIIKAALGFTRGESVSIGSAFSGINWAQVVLASLILGAAIFVGLLLCFLPGLVVIFFTFFTMWFVVDRNQDAITAIKSSVSMVRANIGPLALFFLASIAAYIVGACLCGVGLLAAIPIVILAQAYTFRTLNGDPVTA